MPEFRLKVVQELAQQHCDDAATRLGKLNAEAAKAQQKLDLLLEYRDEYQQRLRTSTLQDVASLRNFHGFLAKLDEAVEHQRATCLTHRQAVQRGQRDWQSKQVKVNAFGTLEERHDAAQAERLKKLEQRATDEFAARAYHSKG
jgi:flagellar FliJ protein